MTIAMRLISGFGLLLALLALSVGAGIAGLHKVTQEAEAVLERDWGRAEAASHVAERTAANGRRTMELFITRSDGERETVRAAISENKAAIDTALQVLEGQSMGEADKALLAQVVTLRKAYVRSFTKVSQLLDEGQREQAEQVLTRETLPGLDQLRSKVQELSTRQSQLAASSGQRMLDESRVSSRLLLTLGLCGIALGLLVAWRMARSITAPLSEAVRLAETVEQGRLDTHVDVRGRDEISQLLTALNKMTAQLANVVGEVRRTSEGIASGSSQIAMGTADLSHRTEEQAANLQHTAASMDELAHTVKENASLAQEACQIAAEASSAASEGGSLMAQLIHTMDEITLSSQKISEIIGVIDGIAFQTNLLALNAAVEAARAGEHGSGFAVVASEVRVLSQRSASAAREINALIKASVERIESGGRLASVAGESIGSVVARVTHVSSMIDQISHSSNEQTQRLMQINESVDQLDQATQQNAALVEQSAAATSSLSMQATRLLTSVQRFEVQAVTT